MKYQTKFEPFALNESFWKEVLLGRTITDVVFDSQGIDYLLLDSGEKLFPDKKENSCRFSLIADLDQIEGKNV